MGSETSHVLDENLESDPEKCAEPESDEDKFLRTVYGSLWRGAAIRQLIEAEKPREIPRLADKERRYILAKHTTSSGTSLPLFWPRSDSFTKCYTISTTTLRNELHIEMLTKDEYKSKFSLSPSDEATRAMRKRISALQIFDICSKAVAAMNAKNLECVDFFGEVQRLWIENTMTPRKDWDCATKIARIYGEKVNNGGVSTASSSSASSSSSSSSSAAAAACDSSTALKNGLMMFKCSDCRRKMERKWPIEIENGAFRNFCDCCGMCPVVLRPEDGDGDGDGNPLMICAGCKVLVCGVCVADVIERYSSEDWVFV